MGAPYKLGAGAGAKLLYLRDLISEREGGGPGCTSHMDMAGPGRVGSFNLSWITQMLYLMKGANKLLLTKLTFIIEAPKR